MSASRSGELTLRPATRDDTEQLFRWANDPLTREMSFRQQQISWDEHVAWLDARLADPRCLLYVALAGAEPIGQVRFDLGREPNSPAVVSMSLSPEHRGRGLASDAIRLATRAAAVRGVRLVHAFIKPVNQESLRAFGRAGYAESRTVQQAGESALRLTFRGLDASLPD